MKSLSKLKLNQLRRVDLGKKEMTALIGGDECSVGFCGCGCYYEGTPGGAPSEINADWNSREGYASPGCEGYCSCVILNGWYTEANPTTIMHAPI